MPRKTWVAACTRCARSNRMISKGVIQITENRVRGATHASRIEHDQEHAQDRCWHKPIICGTDVAGLYLRPRRVRAQGRWRHELPDGGEYECNAARHWHDDEKCRWHDERHAGF